MIELVPGGVPPCGFGDGELPLPQPARKKKDKSKTPAGIHTSAGALFLVWGITSNRKPQVKVIAAGHAKIVPGRRAPELTAV